MKSEPANVFKFCPKCGSKFFKSTDYNRRFECEECLFVYYINNSAAVAALIQSPDQKLLLTRRAIEPAKGMLDLPGGFVEPGERAEEALIREIDEELGLSILKMTYLTTFTNEYIYSGLTIYTLDIAFICEVDDFSKLCPADDVSEVEFYHLDQINESELCSKSMAHIIDYYRNTQM